MVMYTAYEQEAIHVALEAIQQTFTQENVMFSSMEVSNYLKKQLAAELDECFAALFLTSQYRIISFQKLFRGTINASQVHIRVIARKALELNAGALILAHNHPSGVSEPSNADRRITSSINDALEIFDVRLLDHFVVSTGGVCSFADNGWICLFKPGFGLVCFFADMINCDSD